MTTQHKFKALLQAISFIATYIILGAALSQFKTVLPIKFERYAQGILGTLAALITVWIFLRIEKKSLKEYGLNWEQTSFKKFTIGLIGGIVIAGSMIFSQIWYSGLEITLNETAHFFTFFIWSLAFIPLAFMEEIAFRSYPLIRLNKAFGLRATQVILGVLFALYHILMMWSVEASFLGPGIWALAYALAAVVSNGIAVPTGLHFGLNFVQSLIGGQKGIDSIWNVDFPQDVSEAATEANEYFGIGLQLVVLLLCVIATELYIRKKKKKTANVYGA